MLSRKRDFVRIKNSIEIFIVTVFILFYTLAASLVSLHRYWQYNAFWYDFGIFDTTIWKLSRFQLPIINQLSPPAGKIVWADHFNPSSIFLSPLYWISDKAEIILIAQAVVVGLSALVAYFITLKIVKNSLVRVSLIVSYLGFVGLQNALFTDVHNIVFALLPLMLTIWAINAEKWRFYWIFLFITLGFQENMTAAAAMLGIFLILKKNNNLRLGILTTAVGLAYGILTMKILIPLFNGGSYSYQPAIPVFWYEWITRFIYPLDLKFKSVIITYATFGFLPLGTIAAIPLIIEHYLERFVLNSAATRWDLGFHYNAILSPIMFLASLETVIILQNHRITKRLLPVWAAFTIAAVIFLHRFYLHGPLMLATHPVFYQQTKNAKFLADFVSQIPKSGLLMTQNNLATHFTHGNTILLNLDYEAIKPDTIAFDLRPGQNANDFFPLSYGEAELLEASVSANRNYVKNSITDSQIIFTRKN